MTQRMSWRSGTSIHRPLGRRGAGSLACHEGPALRAPGDGVRRTCLVPRGFPDRLPRSSHVRVRGVHSSSPNQPTNRPRGAGNCLRMSAGSPGSPSIRPPEDRAVRGLRRGTGRAHPAALGDVRRVTEIRMFGDCASRCTATCGGCHGTSNRWSREVLLGRLSVWARPVRSQGKRWDRPARAKEGLPWPNTCSPPIASRVQPAPR